MKVYVFFKKLLCGLASFCLQVGAAVAFGHSIVVNVILSWMVKSQPYFFFATPFFIYATAFFHLTVILSMFDDILDLPLLDWICNFICGQSNTIDIKSDVPVLPPRESVVITPELEKAIAICNKEGYSVVQASPDPSTSSFINLANILSLVMIVGFFILKT